MAQYVFCLQKGSIVWIILVQADFVRSPFRSLFRSDNGIEHVFDASVFFKGQCDVSLRKVLLSYRVICYYRLNLLMGVVDEDVNLGTAR